MIQPVILWGMVGVAALLVSASSFTWFLKRRHSEGDYGELTLRIRTWWIIAVLFFGAVIAGRGASIALFGMVSYLAFKEYLSLIPTRRADHRVLFWAYVSIPLQYYWVHIGWYGMFIIFIPVYMFLWLPMRMVLTGETQGFLRAAGVLHWGLMTTVFCLSHLAYLVNLPDGHDGAGGGSGLLLYLLFLTQFNDVAQYVWGKSLGKHQATPQVSPGKTIEGLAGGIVTTVAMAVILAPWLTPLSSFEAVGMGLLIGLAGFVGDVTLSAVKRDIGVKDSGSLLPGHGGILDRVDSLTYTAPLFFHVIYYLHY